MRNSTIRKKKKNNFIKLLFTVFSFLKKGKESKNLILLMIIVSFQAVLDVLSLASVIPLIYLVQDSNTLSIKLENIFIGWGISNQLFIQKSLINIYVPLIVILLMIISTIFRLFLIHKTNNFIEDTRHSISKRLMANFINHNPLLNIDTTEIAKSILSEVDQFIIIVFQPTILMLTNFILLVGIIIYLLLTSFQASIFSLLTLLFFYFLFHYFSKGILNRTGIRSESSNKGRFKTAIESFRNIKDIRIYQVENHFIQKFNKFSRSFANANSLYTTLTASPKYILEMIVFIALALSILFFVIANESSFELLPLLGTFAFGAYKAQPALSNVIFGINSIEYGSKIISNIQARINLKKIPKTKSIFYKKIEKSESCILVRDINFKYGKSIKKGWGENLNFDIKYNSLFIILGESGSGKSTLLNLLAGLIPSYNGSITFNTNLFNGSNPQIAFLHQDCTLINASILENVAFGQKEEDINFEKLFNSLKKAEIYKYVSKLKNTIYENVGEGGSKLSAGQIQRIALARALYFEPNILILDEPTSSLDKDNELNIIETLSRISREITIIMSTHRTQSLPENATIFNLFSE